MLVSADSLVVCTTPKDVRHSVRMKDKIAICQIIIYFVNGVIVNIVPRGEALPPLSDWIADPCQTHQLLLSSNYSHHSRRLNDINIINYDLSHRNV